MSDAIGTHNRRDLQSYLSDLSLFLALESNKLYILVDNRPWLRDLGSRPAHLWQLMVTKVSNNHLDTVGLIHFEFD